MSGYRVTYPIVMLLAERFSLPYDVSFHGGDLVPSDVSLEKREVTVACLFAREKLLREVKTLVHSIRAHSFITAATH